MQNKYAIIVAGGVGARMNTDLPKQFLLINDEPIIIHTIKKFASIKDIHIVLVMNAEYFEIWNQIAKKYLPNEIEFDICAGGETRFQSVKNGLSHIKADAGLVAIHDAVRPFVSTKLIEFGFSKASETHSAVCCVNSKDSLRFVEANGNNKSINRGQVKLIQTPQTFDLTLIKKAYQQNEEESFTDDASVFERDGNIIQLIEGEYSNIKITTVEDLKNAHYLL